MLSSISWSTYITFLFVALSVYYIGIVIVFYRSNLQAIAARKYSFAGIEKSDNEFTSDSIIASGPQETGEINLLSSLIQEVRAYLEQTEYETPKDNLLKSLQSIIAKYEGLNLSAYKQSITGFILSEVKKNCALSISEQEAEDLLV